MNEKAEPAGLDSDVPPRAPFRDEDDPFVAGTPKADAAAGPAVVLFAGPKPEKLNLGAADSVVDAGGGTATAGLAGAVLRTLVADFPNDMVVALSTLGPPNSIPPKSTGLLVGLV